VSFCVIEVDADLVDDLVPPLFPDIGPDQAGLVAMDVMLAKDLLDGVDPGLNGGLVMGGAVLPQQVFEHVGGDDGIAFDGLDEVLSDHEP